jgi:hypothetical protein
MQDRLTVDPLKCERMQNFDENLSERLVRRRRLSWEDNTEMDPEDTGFIWLRLGATGRLFPTR